MTFACGGCKYCRYMNINPHTRLPNGRTYKPQHCANCQTYGVIYLLTFKYHCFYVGKTKNVFWKRAYGCILSMKTCNPELPLHQHVTEMHSKKIPKIPFLILDRIHPRLTGRRLEQTSPAA